MYKNSPDDIARYQSTKRVACYGELGNLFALGHVTYSFEELVVYRVAISLNGADHIRNLGIT
jgi:hypothetical protein